LNTDGKKTCKQDYGMNVGILGGGLCGVALAYFLQENHKINSIEILEKENVIGGLCRSFHANGVYYDIGPHVIFSKDREILNLMIGLLGDNKAKIRRSNKIYYKKTFIKYPFENGLAALSEEEKAHCLDTFIHNPDKDRHADNLLRYFLKIFGEGITNIYLKPYNEKIWKCDPSLMDIQMADRIPRPPPEDIIKSAAGISIEGHPHQLFFYYPKAGGINALVRAFADRLNGKVSVITDCNVIASRKKENAWKIKTDDGNSRRYDLIISTIPVPSLVDICRPDVPADVMEAANGLRCNSIVIAIIRVQKDNLGENFAIMVPDKDIIFHRVSKLNFLGDGYCHKGGSVSLMVEMTCSPNSPLDKMSNHDLEKQIIEDLRGSGLIDRQEKVLSADIRKFKYAYVVDDLNRRRRMDFIRNYFAGRGIRLCGRFGEFEYLNMDAVIRHARDLSVEIDKNV